MANTIATWSVIVILWALVDTHYDAWYPLSQSLLWINPAMSAFRTLTIHCGTIGNPIGNTWTNALTMEFSRRYRCCAFTLTLFFHFQAWLHAVSVCAMQAAAMHTFFSLSLSLSLPATKWPPAATMHYLTIFSLSDSCSQWACRRRQWSGTSGSCPVALTLLLLAAVHTCHQEVLN